MPDLQAGALPREDGGRADGRRRIEDVQIGLVLMRAIEANCGLPIGEEIAAALNRGDTLAGRSPARDVPRVDPLTANVERLARFLYEHSPTNGWKRVPWADASPMPGENYRDFARAMVRDFDELEEILAELL